MPNNGINNVQSPGQGSRWSTPKAGSELAADVLKFILMREHCS